MVPLGFYRNPAPGALLFVFFMEINLNKISSCQMEEAAKAAYLVI